MSHNRWTGDDRHGYIVQQVRTHGAWAGTVIYGYRDIYTGSTACDIVAFLNGPRSPLPRTVASRYFELPPVDISEDALSDLVHSYDPIVPDPVLYCWDESHSSPCRASCAACIDSCDQSEWQTEGNRRVTHPNDDRLS